MKLKNILRLSASVSTSFNPPSKYKSAFLLFHPRETASVIGYKNIEIWILSESMIEFRDKK